jgi:hypothetical protein
MKTELAVSAAKNLITENGQLFVIKSTVKSNRQLFLIPVGLSTSNELTTRNDKVMGVDGHIFFVTELNSSLDNN